MTGKNKYPVIYFEMHQKKKNGSVGRKGDGQWLDGAVERIM